MRLLALVPLRSLQRIREALGERDYVRGMGGAEAMFGQLSGGERWDVIVIDPDLCGQREWEQLLREARKHQAAVMLNSDLAGAGPLAAMVESVSAVVLWGYDDGVSELRQVLDGLPTPSLELRLLQRLAWRFDALPSAARRAALALFSPSHHRIRSMKHLVGESGMGRRSLDRWMTRVGFKPTKWLVGAARLAGTYGSLGHAGVSLREVALQHGYGSVRTLNRQALAMTGFGPRLLSRVPDDELLERLEASVLDSRKTRVVQPLLLPSPLVLAAAHWDGD